MIMTIRNFMEMVAPPESVEYALDMEWDCLVEDDGEAFDLTPKLFDNMLVCVYRKNGRWMYHW